MSDAKIISAAIQFQMERRRAIVQAYAAVRDATLKAHESVLSVYPLPTSWDAIVNKGRPVKDKRELEQEIDDAFRQEIATLDRQTAAITR